MLAALSVGESAFYSCEDNVLELENKSEDMFLELERHYAFVGASELEYLNYFHREDLPPQMWTWLEQHEVKAIAGFS